MASPGLLEFPQANANVDLMSTLATGPTETLYYDNANTQGFYIRLIVGSGGLTDDNETFFVTDDAGDFVLVPDAGQPQQPTAIQLFLVSPEYAFTWLYNETPKTWIYSPFAFKQMFSNLV